jgi:hypothetical protein
MSLPEAPLERFKAKAANLPRTTIQRIGQDIFRDALMAYWAGRCPMTGITAARSPGAPPVAVAVLAGWKAELGERRGEAEALRSCRKSFLGAAVRCSKRCHLRSKARSRSSGY